MSPACSPRSPSRRSGDMYFSEPKRIAPVCAERKMCEERAVPKSSTRTSPSVLIMMLLGFRSRWMTRSGCSRPVGTRK